MSPNEPPRIAEYRLSLDVEFEAGRWDGTLEFDAPSGSELLELDAEGLEIASVRAGTRDVPFGVDASAGRLTIRPTEGDPNPVSVRFSGRVAPGVLLGLYRSGSGDATLLTSQCEPEGARRIFPCLDRPDRKSRLRLTVRARADLEVVSNSPVESVHEREGQKEWSFAPTPPMSTYLFYLGLGRFDRVEDAGGRVAVRVLAPPGRGTAGTFALRAGREILEAYQEYYRIPYPLPKLDLIAVPELAFGAMENWGAISFRDMRLLVDPSASSFTRRDVFETVAHEIAHQWFGNLVTMLRWDDIWLNESFAALMETRLTERLRPEYDPVTDFYLRVAGASAAFGGDALPSTHPVRAHVANASEISQIFDEISYGKGSMILGMLEAYVGEEPFRAGVTDYLERFRYSNARTEDLWEALGRASHEPVGAMMAPWIDRPGHPIVTAHWDGEGLALDQRRYSLLGPGPNEPPWPIPLVLDVDGIRQRHLFSTRTTRIPLPAGATVHLNPGAVGFYRVLYDRTMYDRLLTALPSRSPADRWIVLEDLGTFLGSGDADWPTWRRFVRGLGATDERLVVESIVGTLSALAFAFPRIGPIQNEARTYLAERTDAVGLERRADEPAGHPILRERLAFTRVRLDEAFARDLAERFPEWNRLDPDLHAAVAIARARVEGRAGWNELHRALGSASGEGEAIHLARALAWTRDPELLERTLDLTVSGGINRGHAVPVIAQAVLNPDGRAVVWPWLIGHLPALEAQFRGSGLLSQVLEFTTPLVGLGRSEEVRAFYRGHPFPEGSRGLGKGLDRLQVLERLAQRPGAFEG